MRTVPRRWLQIIKVLHFCSLALWMGGVAAWLPILSMVDLSDVEGARRSYLTLRTIAWNVIGWGGIGSVITGVALAALSEWGFTRHRWVIIKLIAAPALVLFGMFFVEEQMLTNLANLEAGAEGSLLTETQSKIWLGLITLLCGFTGIIAVSVIKPWSRVTAGRGAND